MKYSVDFDKGDMNGGGEKWPDLRYQQEIALNGCLQRLDVIYEEKKVVKHDADVWHLTNQINANTIY